MRHLLLLLTLVTLLTRTLAAAPDYSALVAEARTLAAENSWDRARESYAAALPLAPDAAARRWTSLWLEDASWRSEKDRWWQEGPTWRERHLAAFDAFVESYTNERARDDFWAAAVASRADLEQLFDSTAAWKDRDRLADYYGSQPPSPANARAYVGFLQHTLPAGQTTLPTEAQPFHRHLLDGARIAATPDDRAWCLWQLARLEFASATPAPTEPTLADRAQAWTAALAAAPQTTWEPLIRANEFVWRATTGWAPNAPQDSAAGIPARLTETQRHLEALGANNDETATELRHRLALIESSLRDPQLEIEVGTLFAPGTPIRFSYGTAGLDELAFSLDRVEPDTWLKIPDDRTPRFGPRTRTTLARPRNATALRDWSVTLPPASTFAWHSGIVEAVPSLEPGYYVLTARGDRRGGGDPMVNQVRFVVSSLRGVALTGGPSRGRIFVYGTDDGSAAADQPVVVSAATDSSSPRWTTRTDAQGAFDTPALESNRYHIAATVGGQPVTLFYYPPFSPPSRLFVDTFTDRPLFRPGETAHWKLIARERRDARFAVPRLSSDLNYRIMLGDTPLVDTTPVHLDDYGTLSGDIAIPDHIRSGEATLQLFRGDATHPRETLARTSLFTVDRYVPPAVVAKLTLASPPAAVRPGGQLQLRADANYFSGGPLARAPVQLAMDIRQPWIWSESLSRWNSEFSTKPLEATTSADGSALFTVSLPADLPDNVTLEFTASVLPEGGTPARASTELTVSATGLSIDPLGWTSPRLVAPGDTVAFSAIVRDPQGSPTPFKGEAQLLEFRWNEVWLDTHGRVVPPAELAAAWKDAGAADRHVPDDWTLVHSGYAETIVASHVVSSNADGRIETTFELPHAGLFRLRLFDEREISPSPHLRPRSVFTTQRRGSEPPANEIARETFSLVVADASTTDLPLNPETSLLATPTHFVSGEPLPLLGIAPAGASLAWISVNGETDAVTHAIPISGRIAFHRFEHTPAAFGQLAVQFAYASNRDTHAALSTQLPVSNPQQRLELAIAAAKEQRPGSTTQLTLVTKTADGSAAPHTELAVAVSDEAVHTLVSAEAEASTPVFLTASSALMTNAVWSDGSLVEPRVQLDPRIGALLNPSDPDRAEELVMLSAFEVESLGGYRARAEPIAAGRLQLEAKAKQAMRPAPEPNATGGTESITLRHHFSSTAFWTPAAKTDAHGEARLEFAYPDNLTRWRIDAYALGDDGNTFGSALAFARTSLPFQARLNLPRFLIAGDSVSPSATLVNRSANALRAEPTLTLDGPVEPAAPFDPAPVRIDSNAEASTSWPVRATAAGEARFTLTARAGDESDAMQLSLPVFEDGLQQTTAAFGHLPANSASKRFTLDLPSPLDPARTSVSVQFAPNYAVTILDALPYLVDYPYGCVEQTMSRFLPAVVVRKTLQDLGLDPASVERRILAAESSRDRTRREATAGLGSLDEVIRQSLARLADARTPQGFGWWPNSPSTDLWMTAYVVWGLSLADEAGIDIPDDLARESATALARALESNTDVDDRVAFAWAALARAAESDSSFVPENAPERFSALFAARDRLSASGRAALVLAGQHFATPQQAATLLRNLDNGVQRSNAAGLGATAHWGATRRFWRATESAVESTALTLLALLAADPENPLVDPAAHWLALNRRSAHWSSTRDTAFAVLALDSWLAARGDLDAPGEVELLVNRKPVHRYAYTRDTLLDSPARIALPSTALRAGKNELTLRRVSGRNAVLATALASSWARASDVRPASHLIEASRQFERQKATPTLLGELQITPQPLGPDGSARATEQVTARITLTVPNELEYLMIEVPKPAGCEPLNPLSGWDARLVRVPANENEKSAATSADSGRPLYREEHDDRSVFFLDRLEAGTWELRFDLRAVTPGDFRALPVAATAMYVPEIAANSDARRLRIER